MNGVRIEFKLFLLVFALFKSTKSERNWQPIKTVYSNGKQLRFSDMTGPITKQTQIILVKTRTTKQNSHEQTPGMK